MTCRFRRRSSRALAVCSSPDRPIPRRRAGSAFAGSASGNDQIMKRGGTRRGAQVDDRMGDEAHVVPARQ
jgi:hypothetical protein